MKNVTLIYSLLFLMLFTIINGSAEAQERVTTFGIQFKPIVPTRLMNTGTRDLNNHNVSMTIEPRLGYAFGMVVRAGLTKMFSLETGINYVVRNYRFRVFDNASDRNITTNMTFDGYEIPLTGLIFVRLNQKWYLNSMAGASFDMYPTGGIKYRDQDLELGIKETYWVQASLLANIGAEYRTDKSGYFYLGFSFHRPFSTTADVFFSRWETPTRFKRLLNSELSGNYLTLDFRYFFPEKARNKK